MIKYCLHDPVVNAILHIKVLYKYHFHLITGVGVLEAKFLGNHGSSDHRCARSEAGFYPMVLGFIVSAVVVVVSISVQVLLGQL